VCVYVFLECFSCTVYVLLYLYDLFHILQSFWLTMDPGNVMICYVMLLPHFCPKVETEHSNTQAMIWGILRFIFQQISIRKEISEDCHLLGCDTMQSVRYILEKPAVSIFSHHIPDDSVTTTRTSNHTKLFARMQETMEYKPRSPNIMWS
jgi:hypothetical protein